MLRAAFATTLLFAATAMFAFQLEFRDYGGEDRGKARLPPDYKEPAEFVFGRLMYPGGGGGGRRSFFGGGGDWRHDAPRQGWGNDYPSADRHLLVALRRLTLINARSVEQPVNLEDGDDVFNWPFLYAGRTTSIDLTDEMTDKLREYLNRGGFLICDDMWGSGEQEYVRDLVKRLYPKQDVVELGDEDLVMHSVFDLKDRHRIVGAWGAPDFRRSLHGTAEEETVHWMGLSDEKKHMVLALWFNTDTGDSWEYADEPSYPEAYSALGFRIIVNHVIYALTH